MTKSRSVSSAASQPLGGRSGYHHGNLREALLAAARELVREGGLDAFSLRALAARVGVSAPAIYPHFPNKRALLVEIAASCMREMNQQLAALFARERQAQEADARITYTLAQMRVYIDFCTAEPELFRLTFTGELGPWMPQDAMYGEIQQTMQMFRDVNAEHCGIEDANDPEVVAMVVAEWSMVHGLAMLIYQRRLYLASASFKSEEELVQRVLAQFARMLDS